MKININGKKVFIIPEINKKIIKHEIPSEIFEEDMARRCKYWLEIPQKKYAHHNKINLMLDLKNKGAKTVPSNLIILAEVHADAFPCKYGYEDITEDIICKVGDHSFSFPVSHRKISRKMKESIQKKKSRKDYVSYEKEEIEQRILWILQHKCEKCLQRLRLSWIPQLENRGITEIPIDDNSFAELVFSQSDYVENHKLN